MATKGRYGAETGFKGESRAGAVRGRRTRTCPARPAFRNARAVAPPGRKWAHRLTAMPWPRNAPVPVGNGNREKTALRPRPARAADVFPLRCAPRENPHSLAVKGFSPIPRPRGRVRATSGLGLHALAWCASRRVAPQPWDPSDPASNRAMARPGGASLAPRDGALEEMRPEDADGNRTGTVAAKYGRDPLLT